MGLAARRATRAWNKANDDLDVYVAEQGNKPAQGDTRYLYLQDAVNTAYDKIPARYLDPRDSEDED
ncbi:hypothetical protein [Streptomyces sp. NPDC020747]|uniref:hypothetical protein n=1 Tax=Streptomyces sp. NPDC020747 TaxID=3365086 RepID=UPI0037B08FF5